LNFKLLFYIKKNIIMYLEEYLKKKLSHININLYIKIQNLELLKYIAKKEKIDYRELCKKYIK
jgi:hypothetical protein